MEQTEQMNRLEFMAYELGNERGHADNQRYEEGDIDMKMILAINEINGAVKAANVGVYGTETVFTYKEGDAFPVCDYRIHIEGSVADRLAGAAVCLLDWAAVEGVTLNDNDVYDAVPDDGFSDMAWRLTNMLLNCKLSYMNRITEVHAETPLYAIRFLFGWTKSIGVDLPKHTLWKMAYEHNTVDEIIM